MNKAKYAAKKLFSVILLVLILGMTVVPISAADNTKNFSYNVIDSDSVEIAGYDDSKTEVIIPESVNGKKVVGIGNEAFMENKTITSVVIPDTVTTIGDSAFFACQSLSSINMPKQLKTISRCAFGATNIEEFVAPDSLLEIGDAAFSDCKNLKSITLSTGLRTIGNTAFFACPKMTQIAIPKNVKEIGLYAFGYKQYGIDKAGYESPMVDPVKNDEFLISCYKNTAGEDYVIENGFDFEYLEAVSNTSNENVVESEIQTVTQKSSEQEQVAEVSENSGDNNTTVYIIIAILVCIIIALAIVVVVLFKGKRIH